MFYTMYLQGLQRLCPEFDTLYALRPLKPNTSAGCSSKFEKVVGRKLFGKTDGTHYF